MPSWTAPVLATDRECPDRYEFPIYTITLCFPEALLSLGRLYLWIQPLAASMKYLIQFVPYDQPCGVVAVFLHLIYNTAMDNL